MDLYRHVGGRESNTFVTIAQAETYLSELYTETELGVWMSLTADQKRIRLTMAAEMMGMLPLRGYKIYEGQALCFPRSVQKNKKIIPEAAKRVQAEIAYSVIHRAMLSREDVSDGEVSSQRVSSVSLGGLLMVTFAKSAAGGEIGNVMDAVTRSVQFPTYLLLKQYLATIRGRTVPNATDDDYVTLSTTTTTTTTTTTAAP